MIKIQNVLTTLYIVLLWNLVVYVLEIRLFHKFLAFLQIRCLTLQSIYLLTYFRSAIDTIIVRILARAHSKYKTAGFTIDPQNPQRNLRILLFSYGFCGSNTFWNFIIDPQIRFRSEDPQNPYTFQSLSFD